MTAQSNDTTLLINVLKGMISQRFGVASDCVTPEFADAKLSEAADEVYASAQRQGRKVVTAEDIKSGRY